MVILTTFLAPPFLRLVFGDAAEQAKPIKQADLAK
jgi:O-antigen/teichoic acid export membrane protein